MHWALGTYYLFLHWFKTFLPTQHTLLSKVSRLVTHCARFFIKASEWHFANWLMQKMLILHHLPAGRKKAQSVTHFTTVWFSVLGKGCRRQLVMTYLTLSHAHMATCIEWHGKQCPVEPENLLLLSRVGEVKFFLVKLLVKQSKELSTSHESHSSWVEKGTCRLNTFPLFWLCCHLSFSFINTFCFLPDWHRSSQFYWK